MWLMTGCCQEVQHRNCLADIDRYGDAFNKEAVKATGKRYRCFQMRVAFGVENFSRILGNSNTPISSCVRSKGTCAAFSLPRFGQQHSGGMFHTAQYLQVFCLSQGWVDCRFLYL